MLTADKLLAFHQEGLEEDLKGFGGRDVQTEWDEGKLTAVWTRRGESKDAEFLMRDHSLVWCEKGKEKPYRDFLQEKLAGVAHIAKAMVEKHESAEIPNYVPTKAQIEDGDGSERNSEDSEDALLREVKETLRASIGQTRVFFVKGDAGSGKSTLLERLVLRQAQAFDKKESDFLFFYVSAQGRSLSNLSDAIAAELDSLDADFGAEGVHVLAKRGLWVPIVDGFDELLGAAGYGDAFTSLQGFLDALRGNGVLMVSARSAFYESEFIHRYLPDSSDTAYSMVPVSLMPWGDTELRQFLASCRKQKTIFSKDENALAKMSGRERNMLGKPFFAQKFPGFVDAGASISISGFFKFLVDAYIARESKKIVGIDGFPLLRVEVIENIFVEIADEMWSRGVRELNEIDLRTLAAAVAEEAGMPEDTVNQIRTKISSSGGLRVIRTGGQRSFGFEHEAYFGYFVAENMRRKLLAQPDKKGNWLILDYGIFSDSAIQYAIRDASMADRCLLLANALAGDRTSSKENRGRNLGQMLTAAFSVKGEQGETCADVQIFRAVFESADFGKACLNNVRFEDCRFINRLNLSNCRLVECKAKDCFVDELAVSESTQMGIEGFYPGRNLNRIYRLGDSATETIHSPWEMLEVMRKQGATLPNPKEPECTEKGKEAIGLLRLFVRTFEKVNLVYEEDLGQRKLTSQKLWKPLRDLLVHHKIIESEKRHGSGHAKTSFRRKIRSMRDLLRHETTLDADLLRDNIGDFWRDLRKM